MLLQYLAVVSPTRRRMQAKMLETSRARRTVYNTLLKYSISGTCPYRKTVYDWRGFKSCFIWLVCPSFCSVSPSFDLCCSYEDCQTDCLSLFTLSDSPNVRLFVIFPSCTTCQQPNSQIPDLRIKSTPTQGCCTGTPGYMAGGPVRQPYAGVDFIPSQGL